MAIANHYIVYIKKNTDVTYEQVKEKMDLSFDWYRIQPDLWVLYSTSDEEKLYERLSPLVKEGGNTFICALDISKRQGWMNKKFWKWLRREDA